MGRFGIINIGTLAALLFFSFAGSASGVSAHTFGSDIMDMAKPSIKRFSDENGLPSNSVMAFDRDKDGRFWIGTQDGAAYYNGNKWVVVNMPDRNISNYIYDILPASDGSLWFASDGGGIHVLKDGEWKTYGASAGLPGDFGRALAESVDAAGHSVIWAGTRDGLARFENGVWSRVDLGPDTPRNRVRSLIVTGEPGGGQMVWAATYGGVLRIRGSEIEVVDTAAGLPHNTVYCLYEGTDENGGPVIFAGTEAGLAIVSEGKAVEFELPAEAANKVVRSVLETTDHNREKILWIGLGGGGLLSMDSDGKWRLYNSGAGLQSDNIFALADANIGDGSVWLSTFGTGLARIELGNWATLDESHGLPNKIVFSVTRYGDGYWFGTFGSGAARFEGGKWKNWDAGSGLPDDYVYSLYRAGGAAGSEELWAGTEKGVAQFETGGWTTSKNDHPGLKTETWDFLTLPLSDGRSSQWVATSRGLVERNVDTVTLHDTNNGLPDNRIRAVHAVRTEGGPVIWVGTYGGGVARLENDKWQVFDTNSGLPSNRVLAITEFAVGGQDRLFIATSGGIAVIDPEDPANTPQVINSENTPGMLNNYILDLVKDDRGRLYALTNKGVTRFTPDGRPGRFMEVYTFTTEDGLPSNECVSGSGYFDGQGRLFVGTINGVAILDTHREINDPAAKLLFIKDVMVNGKPNVLAEGSEFSHGENHLFFEYPLLSNFRESATQYRTQLEGLDAEPTNWTSEPHRDLSFVPPGSYRFVVWARDHAGNISEAATPAFIIRPAWWQTWWAMLLYLLVIIGIVSLIAYLVYQNRLNRLLDIERVRTRIATDLHDDIGASLSKIAILSEVMTQKIKRGGGTEVQPLAVIADTSRDLMSSMSDIVWAINPKRDHLIDLVQRMRRFAVDVVSARDMELDFNGPDNADGIRLDLETRRQIHLIFKEAVNNCVRHSGCTKVAVDIVVDPQTIRLEVKDNGKGFDESELMDGNGLASMRSRAGAIGGTLEISPSSEGTLVRLNSPNRSRSGIFQRFKPVR